MAFFSALFLPIMLLQPRGWKNGLKTSWAIRLVSRLVGVRWKIRGYENIVNDSGSVVLINHQSAIDLVVFAELWPFMEGLSPIAKKEVLYYFPYGPSAWLQGVTFIDKTKPEKAVSTLNKMGESVRKNKIKLGMFPEGTRNGGAELLPFKKGAFHVAIASQTPIQPIIIARYPFLDAKAHTFDSGMAEVQILPPIPTAGLTKDDMNQLIEKTYSIMNDAYQKLSQEVRQSSLQED
nr:PREDICTED: 1-acyl-sn-glycerol-3-phosphate acyltransferase alpha-like [Bemisia tabaci]